MRWDSTKPELRSFRIVNKFAWFPTMCRGERDNQQVTVWLEQYTQLQQYWGGYDNKWTNLDEFTELHEHTEMLCVRIAEVLNDDFSEFYEHIQRLLPDGYRATVVDHKWTVTWNG